MNDTLSGPYWLVRKALVIIAFFGGLRPTEVISLVLEKISIEQEGVYVVHERAKQRSDHQSSRLNTGRLLSKPMLNLTGFE